MTECNSVRIGEKHRIGPGDRCFIIAEIGQNHQGSIKIAKQMIKLAKDCGADCVKFQKSHLPSKFNKKALLRPYNSINSWGETYGDHKKYLEFSEQQFLELQKYAAEIDILFTASAMDEVSLYFLNLMNVPFIKIGSGDLHNLPLLRKAAKLHKPLVISTGMSTINEVLDVYEVVKAEHSEFCLLHCVSSYPTPENHINLNVIKTYMELFPDIPVGYSGHELGTEVAVAAVAIGAMIIEKHFTLDKHLKGSDHVCSLTPTEFKEMVEKIRMCETSVDACNILNSNSIQVALGNYNKEFQCSELPCYEKLGKSIVAAKDLDIGEVITAKNICIKVAEPKGIPSKKFDELIGKTVNRDIKADESLFDSDII